MSVGVNWEKIMKLGHYGALLIATSLAGTPAFAQEVEESAEAEVATGGLQEIVVVARRVTENLQTVPIAVTVPSGETLDRAQVVSIDQLPTVVPGLIIQPATAQPASAIIAIRGQSASDALLAIDQAVGQYFDGVYIARSSGALFNFVDVQRVEVLRGAQGTLFGRNTTGGAVSIVSNKPTDNFEGSVRLRHGNYDTWEATGVVNIPLAGDQLALRVVGQHVQNGGYGTNLSFNTPLGGDNVDFGRATLQIAPADFPARLTIVADYTNRRGDGQVVGLKTFPRNPTTGANTNNTANAVLNACSGPAANPLCPVPTAAGDNFNNYAVDFRTGGNFHDAALSIIPTSFAESWGVAATAEIDISDTTAIKTITAWRGVETDSLTDNDGTPYALSGGLREGEGNLINQTQFSQEVQLTTKALQDRLELIVGGFYFTESGNDFSGSYGAWPLGARRLSIVDGDITNKSYAGFGQFNFNITDTVRFTGGLRYTRDERSILRRNRAENTDPTTGVPNGITICNVPIGPGGACENLTEANFGYWSYTAGLDWQAAEGVFLYLKTSQASRSGGFNARATGTTPLTFGPETVNDYEFGFKLDLLDRRLRINTAVFQTDYDGIQRTVPFILGAVNGVGGTLSNLVLNAASARIRGLETEITAQPADGLQIGASATFLDPEFVDFTIPTLVAGVAGTQDVRDTPYSFVSKQAFSVFADYTTTLGSGELSFRADYAWRSDRFGTGPLVGPGLNEAFRDDARIPGYGILNAQIAYQFDNPDVELAIYGQNIGDKEYFQRLLSVGPQLGVTAYTPGLPRMYGLRMTYRFGD